MIDINVPLGDLIDGDIVIYDQFKYPIAVVGRNTYTGCIHIRSARETDVPSEIHLIQIGRYSSIGENITIFCDMDHDYRSVYQGCIYDFYDLDSKESHRAGYGQCESHMLHKGMIVVGSDVWIGDNVTLLPSITIGDGAVIAAGSVVTGDVPSYAIYGGNPARLIKYRFSETIRKEMMRIQWWNLSAKELLHMKDDMQGDVETFVEKYQQKSNQILRNYDQLPSIKKGLVPIYVSFLDITTNYATFGSIVEQFAYRFPEGEAELILCYNKDSTVEVELIKQLSNLIVELPYNSLVITCGINKRESEGVIKEADYLFVGHGAEYIDYVGYAFKYNIKCLSGVDVPLFR